jgi:Ca2+-binding EF-hand superfamily protein
MGENEDHFMAILKRDLNVISELCKQFEGRVLKYMGDGCLVVFESGVHAVECAQEIQRHFAEQEHGLLKDQLLKHRIGIHLGDVYITENDVMGDGVNVASRLQSEAPPGGICISQTLYEVVKTRLSLKTVYQGPKKLKNIKQEVHLYQIQSAGDESEGISPARPVSITDNKTDDQKPKKHGKKLKYIIVSLVIVIISLLLMILFAANKPFETTGMFSQFDRNNDKKISPMEIPQPIRRQFMQMDTNNDHAIDMKEFKKGLMDKTKRQSLQMYVFERLDLNHDRQLTSDEIPQKIKRRILRADENKDGIVTEAEINKAIK